MKAKYNIKKTYRIIQYILLFFGFIFGVIRWLKVFNNSFVVITLEITSHISNFSLSLLAYLVIGSLWLTSGVKFSYITGLGIFLIAANFICETLMAFINTTDIIDAIYGTGGTVLVFIYLYCVNRNGLMQI